MIYKIYKIINEINDEIYIGSTKQTLSARMSGHRRKSKNEKCKNRVLYQLAETHGWNRFKIILIEEFECKNNEERFRKEQHYIDELKPVLNKYNAYGSRCEHNRVRSLCKTCGGGSICEHNWTRTRCKECGGGSICEHNRERSSCKECGGGSICEHNRVRSQCKECGGGSICEHNRMRSQCKECGGGSICEHNRRKSYCKDCNNYICEICDKKYCSKYSLKNHLNKIHNL